jgi:hypothetical protein
MMKRSRTEIELRTVLLVFCGVTLLLIAQLAVLDGWLGI